MNIFTSKDRLITCLKYPIAVTALYVLVVHIISLVLPKFNVDIEVVTSLLLSACVGMFLGFYEFKESSKSFVVALSLLCANAVFFLLTSHTLGLTVIVALAVGVVLLGNNLDFEYLLITTSLLGVAFGVAFGICDELLQMYVKEFALLIKGRAVLFGVLNEIYSVFFGNFFSNLIYTTDCSVATLVNGKIIAGVQNVFLSSPKAPQSSVADYLTGKYFFNVFMTFGTFVALFKKTSKRYLFSFLLPCLLSVVFGDNTLLLLFLLFYNPLIFVGCVFVGGVGYFVSALVDIRIGFEKYASLFSLFKYGRNVGYFLLVGFVLAVLMYFIVEIVLSKFDMDNQKYYPKDVRALVRALGGERNIETLENGVLTVRNPNLIDILKVDCEIHQNTVQLIDNDYNLLKEYF
ncbi:hypothetical protein [uncultured Eubacterium sp.]|uniref:hypothetical protein n=1 Tax=uncultured Eubacterium sp. TaxID=165185 RepID=UPI0026057EB1|nr:hypothetical protein [uncultured Eubacterium sp.]